MKKLEEVIPGLTRCSIEWKTWEIRLKEQLWPLKQAIEWVADPTQWGIWSFPTKFIPKDFQVYKKQIWEFALKAINDRQLKSAHDGFDHHVIPLQFIAFLRSNGFVLPYLCQNLISIKEHEPIAEEFARRLKSQKLKIKKPKPTGKKQRVDRIQMSQFLKIAAESIANHAPNNYVDFFSRPEIIVVMNSFTDANGKTKIHDLTYLKRRISKFMPDIAKKAGRPPKSCKVGKSKFF